MDPNQNQIVDINTQQQLPKNSKSSNLLKLFLIILGILVVMGVGIGGFVLGSRHNQVITSIPTVTTTPIKYVAFTDSAKIFTLQIPQNYGTSKLSSYVTDSCTVFSDKSIINPGMTASEEAILQKEGTFIEVCYTSNTFPDSVPTKLTTSGDDFTILSSTPLSLNGYSGFKANVSSTHTSVKDLVILKSPYGGYVTISKQVNGQEVFDKILASFNFIAQKTKLYSTADQTVIRKMFSDQYQKDITVTFSHPSPNQNSVGGFVYLPQGQRCFNADRTDAGWKISYVGTGVFDSKCYKFDNL